jgi:hypothetical protein
MKSQDPVASQTGVREMNLVELYLICDIGGRQAKTLHVVDNDLKSQHWKEVLMEQGKDVHIILLSNDIITDICEKTEDQQ